jgi:cytochrome c-type biogenesis protein CcmH/NrfG
MNRGRIEKLLEFLAENPADLFSKYALALEYSGGMKAAEAERLFREVIAADPAYVAAYYQLGKLLADAGKIAEAINIFETGLEAATAKKEQRTVNEFMAALEDLKD